jgi:spore coat protein U-like protein
MFLRRAALSLLFSVLALQPAAAQSCSFSNTGVNFGNVNLTSGGFQSATGTFAAQCSGTPGRTIRICPNFNAGSGGVAPSGSPRYLLQGGTTMEYDLFRTNGVGQTWGSYTWGNSSRPPVLTVTLNANGFGSVSQTIFARLYNQQGALPTGTYSSVFSGNNTQIDYGYSTGFNCSSALSSRVQSVPFIVRTTNNSTCTITASDLSFGNHSNLSAPIVATNQISVTCTAGTQYEIGLNNGSSGAADPSQRRMTNTATAESILYNVFRDGGRTQHWGNVVGSNTVVSTGTGTAQMFTGYGRVPAQTTPSSLTYTDNVIVTITY